MATNKATNQAAADAARKAAKSVANKRQKERTKLAKQFGLKTSDFVPNVILATMAKHHIPRSLVWPGLLVNADEAPAPGEQSISLDMIPDRPEKGPGRANYKRRVAVPAGPNPNEGIILRLLDMVEKPNIKDEVADRLLTVLEKLV